MELATFLFFNLTILMVIVSPLHLISPSAILSGSWGFVFLLQSIFASDMRDSSLSTLAIFFITLAFSAGEIIGCSAGKFRKRIKEIHALAQPKIINELKDRESLKRIVIIFGVISIAGALQYAYALGLLEASSFAELILLPGLARQDIYSGTLDIPLLSRIGFLFAYSGVVFSLAYYYLFKWHWWLCLSIVAVLLLGMSQSGRAGIVIVLLQSMITFYLKNIIVFKRKLSAIILKGIAFPLILIAILFIGGQFLREGFGSTDIEDILRVIKSLRAYLFGGLSAFSYWITDIYNLDRPTLGVFSFSSLFAALGIYPQANGIYDFYAPISQLGETSNIYTAYRSFIEDFSLFGACFFYLFSGYFIGLISFSLLNGRQILIFTLIPLLSWLAFSPMASLTYFNSFLLSCLLPFLLARNFKGVKYDAN